MAVNTRDILIKTKGLSYIFSVNPKEISFAGGEETISYSFLNSGEVEFPGNPKPYQLDIDTFLPSTRSPFFKKGMRKPSSFVKKLRKLKEKKKNVRIIVSNTPINHLFLIKSPVLTFKEGDTDYHFTCSFVEDRRKSIKIKKKKKKKKAPVLYTRSNGVQVPKYVTWTKKSKLWDIARKYYGKGSYSKYILRKNNLTKEKDIKLGMKVMMVDAGGN